MDRKPRLFVGSSVEGLPIANAIQENLDHDAEVTVWPQGVFVLSASAVDSLLRTLDATDFGVFVFNPDDVLKLRGEEYETVRDNVIFELGLFIGKLGRQRSFIILPRGHAGLHLPSDLAGLTPAGYEPHRSDGNLQAALGAACNQIRRAIQQLGPVAAPAAVIRPADPRETLLAGVRNIAEYIAKAIGPQGIAMAVTLSSGRQIVTKSGSMIAKGITAVGLEGRGATQIRDLAQEMDDSMGDGAKLAVLMLAAMADRGTVAIRAGHLPRDITEGMRRASEAARSAIFNMASPTRNKAYLTMVAATAAQSDAVAKLVVDAIEYAGKDGMVTVQDASVDSPRLERVEGTRFERGYISHYFADRTPDARVDFADCYVLVTAERISSMAQILHLLEGVAATNRPLLIVAADVTGEALATLIVNVQRGGLRSVAVTAPGAPNRSMAVLEDLAVLCGATLVTPDVGLVLERATLADLGRAKHVQVTRDSTTVVDGAGDPEKIDLRAATIRHELDQGPGDFERGVLYERLARLSGKVANILVGGLTPSDVFETKYQFESALHSAHKAIESGVVPGGASSLLAAANSLESLSSGNAAEAAGIEVVRAALEAPIRALIATARAPADETLVSIRTDERPHPGFDSASGTVVDVGEAGIFDPTATVARALESAFTYARQILLTEAWEPESE